METFPIGGWSERGGGGHSFIFDHIAVYGVIGIVLLFVFYRAILRLFYYPYQDKPWSYYYLYGLLGVTFFYIFNPSAFYPQLLFAYPLSAYLINYKLQDQQ